MKHLRGKASAELTHRLMMVAGARIGGLREAAKRLGISESNAYQRVSRERRKRRALVEARRIEFAEEAARAMRRGAA